MDIFFEHMDAKFWIVPNLNREEILDEIHVDLCKAPFTSKLILFFQALGMKPKCILFQSLSVELFLLSEKA